MFSDSVKRNDCAKCFLLMCFFHIEFEFHHNIVVVLAPSAVQMRGEFFNGARTQVLLYFCI